MARKPQDGPSAMGERVALSPNRYAAHPTRRGRWHWHGRSCTNVSVAPPEHAASSPSRDECALVICTFVHVPLSSPPACAACQVVLKGRSDHLRRGLLPARRIPP